MVMRSRCAAGWPCKYERKGHRFVDLDVEVTANGVAVWSVFHTAIWQPRAG